MGKSGMTVSIPRDFHADNAWSLSAGTETFWDAVYRKAFPNMTRCELCTNLQQQRKGIDRMIYLSNGNILTVDEKKRGKEYDDILLEHTSNRERNTPGWIAKDLVIDYLAYGFITSQRCYLFPWPLLRRAWLQFGDKWKGEHREVVSTTTVGNTVYHTVSVAVPTVTLQRAVTTAAVIDVSVMAAD